MAGVLIPVGVPGVYGKGRSFIEAFDGLYAFVSTVGEPLDAELYRFPPVARRADIVRTGYLESFPDLLGSVHAFSGDDPAHADLLTAVEQGEEWTSRLEPTEVVLLPAACYPLYPMAAGRLPVGGRTFDVLGMCFRHEPSADPARMLAFHMREFVRIGDAETAVAFRDAWLERALQMLEDLGLRVTAEVANDPFFGQAGVLMARSQREAALKYEVRATIADTGTPTAVVSCNCHRDHLTTAFGIETADGARAHSACIGFGMERIVLALFAAHGTDPGRWPAGVRKRLFS